MFFVLITFLSAFFLESIGSIISIWGITHLFGANPLIIALAIALDVGKCVTVSLLYSYWKQLSLLMKSYALLAAVVTMIITSAGAFGFLSGQFQQAIIGTKEGEQKVQVLKEQQARYQERKKQIDDQIAKLPEKTTVSQRLRLMRGFKTEQETLDAKISAIDKELPDQQIKQISTEAKAGPILYIAKAFDVPVEQAVKYVILLIIFVFDPLAIFLIISGNFLWAQRKQGAALERVGEKIRTNRFPPEDDNLDASKPLPESHMYEVDRSWPIAASAAHEFDPAYDAGAHESYQGDYEPIYTKLEPTPRSAPRPTMDELLAKVTPENTHGEIAPDGPVGMEFPTQEDREALKAWHTEHEAAPEVQGGLLSPIDVSTENGVFSGREQITRSSLGLIEPDPRTIVDAGRFSTDPGRAKTLKTPVPKDRNGV